VQAKFKSAMIYPVMVICVGILLVMFFMMVMMPKFIEIFNGFNIELPLPTRMLIATSNFFTNFWCIVIGAGVLMASFILFKRFQSSPAGGRKLDEDWSGGSYAYKSVSVGLQAVAERLRVQADGKPRLYICRDALVRRDQDLVQRGLPSSTLDEIPGYVWAPAPDGKPVKDHPLKINDHGCDALRYMCVDFEPKRRVVGAARTLAR